MSRLANYRQVIEDIGPMSDDKVCYLYGPRPEVRSDCLPGGCNEERPCPWISCKHHLGVDITRMGVAEYENWEERETCSLDVAEDGTHTLEAIAAFSNMTRERVRQIEAVAKAKLRTRTKNAPYWIRLSEYARKIFG